MTARLVTRKIKGKDYQVLTSMIDPLRYPLKDIVGLYEHRWEIELGYREIHVRKSLNTTKPST